MIEAILHELSLSTFDFRAYANPEDPLAHLFEEWVPYYRLKHAIAKALQPKSILEVGVRFGYSARAFLEAAPSAKLLGIDLDSDLYGGEKGALEWARQITAGYAAEFAIADSQKMERFPGGIYDLIHVDGQQDGLGTFHDLRRAVNQASWVLVDGYFWTRENFFNANDFVLKYKDVLSYALTIPGYQGELLLRVSDDYLANRSREPGTESSALTGCYDSHYYLHDCAGYRTFRRFGGDRLEDHRLLSMLMLARLNPGGPALDLGCGRGEITYQLAAGGIDVTAVDYSPAAIELAQNAFHRAPDNVRQRASFICGDVNEGALEPTYGVALAADLIEHLAPTELERLYARVAAHLGEAGVFVVHTSPNIWRYRRDDRYRRAEVERLGGYMPAEPRTRYELLVHINEQSPAKLRRALLRHFPHVKVWLGIPANQESKLSGKASIAELTNASDVYALASRASLDLEKAAQLLKTVPLPDGTHAQLSIEVPDWPREVKARAAFELRVRVHNLSGELLMSLLPVPVRLSYHWVAVDGEMIAFDGLRSSIPFGLDKSEARVLPMTIQAPAAAGSYRLIVTLIQEDCCWFEELLGFEPAEGTIEVVRVS